MTVGNLAQLLQFSLKHPRLHPRAGPPLQGRCKATWPPAWVIAYPSHVSHGATVTVGYSGLMMVFIHYVQCDRQWGATRGLMHPTLIEICTVEGLPSPRQRWVFAMATPRASMHVGYSRESSFCRRVLHHHQVVLAILLKLWGNHDLMLLAAYS